MAALPICDELRRSVGKSDWEPQFILRCRREISEYLRLTREINVLCMRLTAIVDEREVFADRLDMLARKGLFADFSRFMLPYFWSFALSVVVDGGVPEGGVGSAVVATSKPSFYVGCTLVGWRGIVEMIVSAMVFNTSGGGVSVKNNF
nr:hypothetical protein [Tanacetum cinerariifolium]